MSINMGHNGMSRDEWLNAILQSGEVTRIAQHLALVIYHLSDPATNTAKLSARDLERITGWGRTAIIEHIDEMEIYIRVKWGSGRAKALFELQGVITEALQPYRSARDADTNTDATVGTISCVQEPDTTADTTADTTRLWPSPGHKKPLNAVLVAASRTQTPKRGDYRGVTINSSINPYHHQGDARWNDADATPKQFVVHSDGSFSGTAFEAFTATEVASMRVVYSYLDILAELAHADRFLAKEFDRDGTEFGSQDRVDRLHVLLRKRNAEAMAMVRANQEAIREKARAGADDSCWFAEDRLMVANGFESELLELVSGDSRRLRLTLDKAAASVPIDLRGPALRKVVRGQFARHADWSQQDERKTRAYEKKLSGDKPQSAETQAERWLRLSAQKAGDDQQ